ncbi:MAG: hypothetical protein ACREYE_16845 [Gammaproteobacteria bacterium]
MSEEDALDRARQLIDQGNAEDAWKLLWPLCESRNRVTRLNAIFALLVALNPITENDKLVLLADKGIETAAHLGLSDERAYLLSRKVFYLLNHLSLLVHRMKNLTLSARVFKWIDFSLERDKKEYDAISKRRVDIEKEIASTATLVEKLAEECTDHRVRGQLFESIGDYYSTWFFLDCLDLQRGGRIRAKIFNLRFVRRWNLTYFLYDRESRKKILVSKRMCFQYLERAVAAFEAANLRADVARACYNLAAKLMLTNHFVRAQHLLLKAKSLVDSNDAKLVHQIGKLEQRIRERNRVTPNYVEELGLDMP